MSAFMCSPEHIATLVKAATQTPGQHGDPCRVMLKIDRKADAYRMHRSDRAVLLLVVNELRKTNFRSLSARYGLQGAREMQSGDGTPMSYETALFEAFSEPEPVDPVEALKLLDSYCYQSCEFKGWPKSDAHGITEAMRRHFIRLLPGYDDAPWSL